MVLTKKVFGFIDVMTYFYVDDETRCGFLIDPGSQAKELLEIIEEKNFTIEKILLTHGHFDHIGAVNEIRTKLRIPVIMHENGKDYASNTLWNLSKLVEEEIILRDVTFLKDGSEIILNGNPDFKVKLIAAPGHTKDGAIYYSEKDSLAFVGDTIFKNGFGRTDFFGGDAAQLMKTIKEKIFTLPDKTILLSGHSEATTVEEERQRNLF